MLATLSLEQAAKLLQVSPLSLRDKRYRVRLGLPARRIGRKLIFAEEDVKRLLECGKERLPAQERGGGDADDSSPPTC